LREELQSVKEQIPDIQPLREELQSVKEQIPDIQPLREELQSVKEQIPDIQPLREELQSVKEQIPDIQPLREELQSVKEQIPDIQPLREELQSVKEQIPDIQPLREELQSVKEQISQETDKLNNKISTIVNTGSTDALMREEVKNDILKFKEEHENDVEQKISTMSKFIHSHVITKMNDIVSNVAEDNKQQIQSLKETDILPLTKELQSMREDNKQQIQSLKETDILPLTKELQSMREDNKQQIQSLKETDILPLTKELQSMREDNKQQIKSLKETMEEETNNLQMKISLLSSSNTNIVDGKISTMGEFIHSQVSTSIKQDISSSLSSLQEQSTSDISSLKSSLSSLQEQSTSDISSLRENINLHKNEFINYKTNNEKSLIMLKQELETHIHSSNEKQQTQINKHFEKVIDVQNDNMQFSIANIKLDMNTLNQQTRETIQDNISSLKSSLQEQTKHMSLLESQTERNVTELKNHVSAILKEEEHVSSSLSNIKSHISSLSEQMTTSLNTLKTIYSTSQKEQDEHKQTIDLLQSTTEIIKINQEVIQQELTAIKTTSITPEEIDRIIHRIDDIEKWIPKETNIKMIIHTEPQPSKIPKPKVVEIPKEESTPKTFKPKSSILQPKTPKPPTPSKSPSTESTFKAKLAEILQQELSKYKLTQYETVQKQLVELMEFKKQVELTQSKHSDIEINMTEIKEHINRELSNKQLSTKTQFGRITEDILVHIEEIIQDVNKLKEEKSQPIDDEILRTKLNILSSQTSQFQQSQTETEQRWLKQIDQLKTECASMLTSTSNQNIRLCEYKVELGNIEQSIKQLNNETITPISSKVKHIEEQIKSLLDTFTTIQKEIKQLNSFLINIKETGLQTSTRLDQMENREKEREDLFQQIEQQRTEKDKERQQFNELLLEKLRQMKTDIAIQIKNTSKEQKDKYDNLLAKHAELYHIHKELASNVSGLSQHQAHIDEKLTIHMEKYEQELLAIYDKHQSMIKQQLQDVQKNATYLSNLREELTKQEQSFKTETQTTKQTLKQLENKYIELQKDIQNQLQKERQALYEKYVDQQTELERQIKSQMTQIQISLHDSTKYMKVNLEQQIHTKDEDLFQLKQQVQQLQKQNMNKSTQSIDLETVKETFKEMIKPVIQQFKTSDTPRHVENTYTPSVTNDPNLESVLQEIRALKNENVLIKRRLKYLEEH
jgi:chromosome segregation ATPase